jgi:hypothetical protein
MRRRFGISKLLIVGLECEKKSWLHEPNVSAKWYGLELNH